MKGWRYMIDLQIFLSVVPWLLIGWLIGGSGELPLLRWNAWWGCGLGDGWRPSNPDWLPCLRLFWKSFFGLHFHFCQQAFLHSVKMHNCYLLKMCASSCSHLALCAPSACSLWKCEDSPFYCLFHDGMFWSISPHPQHFLFSFSGESVGCRWRQNLLLHPLPPPPHGRPAWQSRCEEGLGFLRHMAVGAHIEHICTLLHSAIPYIFQLSLIFCLFPLHQSMQKVLTLNKCATPSFNNGIATSKIFLTLQSS